MARSALAVLCFAVGLASLRYLGGDPSIAPPPLRASMAANGWIFVAHAVVSAVALVIAPLQLATCLRSRSPRTHRWLGRLYVVCCVVGAGSALAIARDVESGPIATAGFSALACAWIVSTIAGWRAIRHRRVTPHRDWMIRSFALTASAVSLRLQMLGSQLVTGQGYGEISHILAWSCWVPQLILVELALRAGRGRLAAR